MGYSWRYEVQYQLYVAGFWILMVIQVLLGLFILICCVGWGRTCRSKRRAPLAGIDTYV